MSNYANLRGRKGGVLFTAGPICTSETVRQAQMIDYGSRDSKFVNSVKDVRDMLLAIGHVTSPEWAAIPLQGSGTMGVEACLSTIIPRDTEKKTIIVRNGAYGNRMSDVATKIGASVLCFEIDEGIDIDLKKFEDLVVKEKDCISTFGMVHCETSTGMFNPIKDMSRIVRKHCPNASIVIDAMSSFGAVDLYLNDICDVMVSSANKCIQGVAGFSIILCRRSLLDSCKGRSRSYTLDIQFQCEGLDKTGQFNNTPPVQAIMAFRQALEEHKDEGGSVARGKRYKEIAEYIANEMTTLGFKLFLDRTKPSFGYIITSYMYPKHPKWNFIEFYSRLNDAGFVIYPGKVSKSDTFRIGSLGDISLDDAKALMTEINNVIKTMDINLK